MAPPSHGWRKVFIGLAFSTFLGFGGGLLLMNGDHRQDVLPFTPRIHPPMVRQVADCVGRFHGLSHGSNDGQKFIGVFTLVLLLGGLVPDSPHGIG